MRLTLIILALIPVLLVLVLGVRGCQSDRPPLTFWNDMVHQDKYKSQGSSAFFADGRTMRQPPAHAVPWGRDARQPDASFAVADEMYFDLQDNPRPMTRSLLQEGRLLYDINCAVCHGGTGVGNGITTEYGMLNPPSFHTYRLLEMPDGEIFRVITQGKGQMGPAAERLRPDQRWAVVAYVRALQLSRHVPLDEVPARVRRELEEQR